jgi:hypothetical protein
MYFNVERVSLFISASEKKPDKIQIFFDKSMWNMEDHVKSSIHDGLTIYVDRGWGRDWVEANLSMSPTVYEDYDRY